MTKENHLIVIGSHGSWSCYLNVGIDVAIERWLGENTWASYEELNFNVNKDFDEGKLYVWEKCFDDFFMVNHFYEINDV